MSEGDSIKIGQVVLSVEEAGGEVAAEQAAPAPSKAAPVVESQPAAVAKTETVQAPPTASSNTEQVFILPELGENITKATIIKVLINVGDEVEEEQSVLELETDKATIEVPSSVVGKVNEVLVKEGDVLSVGSAIFKAVGSGTQASAPAPTTAPVAAKVETSVQELVEETPAFVAASADAPKVISVENQPPILQNAAPAAPSVRRLAREIGVDVNQIQGSGAGGRIILDDVKAFSKTLHQQRNEVQHIRAEQHQVALPDFSKFGTIERQAMSNIRFKTAEHLDCSGHRFRIDSASN